MKYKVTMIVEIDDDDWGIDDILRWYGDNSLSQATDAARYEVKELLHDNKIDLLDYVTITIEEVAP